MGELELEELPELELAIDTDTELIAVGAGWFDRLVDVVQTAAMVAIAVALAVGL